MSTHRVWDGGEDGLPRRRRPTIPVIVDGNHIDDVDVDDLERVLERGDVELRTGLDGKPYLVPVRR